MQIVSWRTCCPETQESLGSQGCEMEVEQSEDGNHPPEDYDSDSSVSSASSGADEDSLQNGLVIQIGPTGSSAWLHGRQIQATQSLLRTIEEERLPNGFGSRLRNHLVAEVRDSRGKRRKPVVRRVILRPDGPYLACEFTSLVKGGLSRWMKRRKVTEALVDKDDLLELEKEFVKATAPPLCLDPSPSVAYVENMANYERGKWRDEEIKAAVAHWGLKKEKVEPPKEKPHDFAFHTFLTNRQCRPRREESEKLTLSLSQPPCRYFPPLEPPSNLDDILKLIPPPSPQCGIRPLVHDGPLKKVEEYALETERRRKPHTTKLIIFQRSDHDWFHGELEMEASDGNYPLPPSPPSRHVHSIANSLLGGMGGYGGKPSHSMNGVFFETLKSPPVLQQSTKCSFELGSAKMVALYVKQFSDIFTEDGRRPCKITYFKEGQEPIVLFSNGPRREEPPAQPPVQIVHPQPRPAPDPLPSPPNPQVTVNVKVSPVKETLTRPQTPAVARIPVERPGPHWERVNHMQPRGVAQISGLRNPGVSVAQGQPMRYKQPTLATLLLTGLPTTNQQKPMAMAIQPQPQQVQKPLTMAIQPQPQQKPVGMGVPTQTSKGVAMVNVIPPQQQNIQNVQTLGLSPGYGQQQLIMITSSANSMPQSGMSLNLNALGLERIIPSSPPNMNIGYPTGMTISGIPTNSTSPKINTIDQSGHPVLADGRLYLSGLPTSTVNILRVNPAPRHVFLGSPPVNLVSPPGQILIGGPKPPDNTQPIEHTVTEDISVPDLNTLLSTPQTNQQNLDGLNLNLKLNLNLNLSGASASGNQEGLVFTQTQGHSHVQIPQDEVGHQQVMSEETFLNTFNEAYRSPNNSNAQLTFRPKVETETKIKIEPSTSPTKNVVSLNDLLSSPLVVVSSASNVMSMSSATSTSATPRLSALLAGTPSADRQPSLSLLSDGGGYGNLLDRLAASLSGQQGRQGQMRSGLNPIATATPNVVLEHPVLAATLTQPQQQHPQISRATVYRQIAPAPPPGSPPAMRAPGHRLQAPPAYSGQPQQLINLLNIVGPKTTVGNAQPGIRIGPAGKQSPNSNGPGNSR